MHFIVWDHFFVFYITVICEKHCYFLKPLWRCGRERGSAVWQSEWSLPPYGKLRRPWPLRFLWRLFRPSCATSCWSSGPLGWAGPTLATTEPSGLLQDTARSAIHSRRTRGSRIVWPKQIKWSRTSPARNKSVHPLVVEVWRNLVSFLLLSPSLILSLTVCAGHGFWCYRSMHVSIHLALDLFLPPLFIVSTHSDFTATVVVFWLISSLSLSASISPPRLSTHTFLYLISALQSPCLALGSSTALSVVVRDWVFLGSQGSAWHTDPKQRAQWATCLIFFPH